MEKLKKFKGKLDFKKKALIGVYAILIIGIILMGTTYAVYQTSDEVTFINARVGKFVANDIELAMTLDGKEVESPPEKNSLYTVTVNCDNATGRWDMNEWAAVVGSISSNKVKCQVDFSTPEPTLSEVTATSDKTTISLSYTAGGIGTNTTCVYGTDTNYGNTVYGTTNSNCNITGLEMDTTYYYKVCAKNGAGEVCKDGSIKTKPNLSLRDIKVGDYISMTPTATSYTIGSDLTGYTSDQAINPSELNLWRVINKNADGTVEMVSDRVSSKSVYFDSKTGFRNLINSLNIIAAQYTDGLHIQSTRHVGYNNQIGILEDTIKFASSSKPWPIQTSNGSWGECVESKYLCGENEDDGAGDIGYERDYNLINSVYGSMIGNDNLGKASTYWLASRYYSTGDSERWSYGGRKVSSNGELSDGLLYITSRDGTILNSGNSYTSLMSGGNPRRTAARLRVIVTLKTNTEILKGEGTSDIPYILPEK